MYVKNPNFRIEWKETKWHVFNVKRITFKMEAYGKLFYFDKDGFQAGLQEFEIDEKLNGCLWYLRSQ